MKMRYLPAADFTPTLWAGGTTTQLYIHPPEAHYAARNFDFRISTATVKQETSLFTALPGFSRKLMVLNGATTLVHEGHHTAHLQKFDVDAFLGDWKTTSNGTCTDFNVMTNSDVHSSLQAMPLSARKTSALHFDANALWAFVYVALGRAHAENFMLKQGDLLVIEQPAPTPMSFHAEENCVLVVTEIMQR